MKTTKIIFWITALIALGLDIAKFPRVYNWTGFDFGLWPYWPLVVPSATVIIFATIYSLFKSWEKWHIAYISLSIFIICFFSLIAYSYRLWQAIPTKKVCHYEELIGGLRFENPEEICILPKKIPEDARDVNFYFQPGILQSRDIIILQYTTSPEKINKYCQELSGKENITWNDWKGFIYHYIVEKHFDIEMIKRDYSIIRDDVLVDKKNNKIIFLGS